MLSIARLNGSTRPRVRSSRSLYRSRCRLMIGAAAIIFALEFLVLLLARAYHSGTIFDGSPSSGRLGRIIATYGEFVFIIRPPLYPLLLAMLMRVSPEHWKAMLLVLQGLTFTALGALCMYLARRISHSVDVMLIAGALYAFNSIFAMEAIAERETLFFSLITILVIWLCAERVREYVKTSDVVVLAILCTMAHLTRPNGFLLAFGVLIYFTVMLHAPSRRQALQIFLMVLCILVLPWQLHLSTITGEVTLTSARISGFNLWKGNHPSLETIYPWVDIDVLDEIIDRDVVQKGLNPLEADKEFSRMARQEIRKHPVRFLERAACKLMLYFSPLPTPIGFGGIMISGGEVKLAWFHPAWSRLFFGTVHGACLLLGVMLFLANWTLSGDRMRHFALCSLLCMGLFAVSYAATFAETRYRLPFDAPMALVAAQGIRVALRRRSLRRALPAKSRLQGVTIRVIACAGQGHNNPGS